MFENMFQPPIAGLQRISACDATLIFYFRCYIVSSSGIKICRVFSRHYERRRQNIEDFLEVAIGDFGRLDTLLIPLQKLLIACWLMLGFLLAVDKVDHFCQKCPTCFNFDTGQCKHGIRMSKGHGCTSICVCTLQCSLQLLVSLSGVIIPYLVRVICLILEIYLKVVESPWNQNSHVVVQSLVAS